jgi:two-component response regulator (ARR-B family)
VQKYRLYLSRLQKDNEQKSSPSGMKHSDLPSKDVGNFNFPNSANKQQNDASIDRCNYSEGTLHYQNMDTKCHEEIIPHSTTSAKVLVNNIVEKEK